MDIQKHDDKKDLTIKQRRFIKEYIACGNATEAAMKAYDCKDRDSANAIGSENLAKLSYVNFLEEAGVTDKLLQEKIMEGLDATKTVGAKVIQHKGGMPGAGELPNANSLTDDFIDVPDFIARHKYLETALKLKKRLTNTEEGGNNGFSVNIIISNGFVPTTRKTDVTPVGSDAERPAPVQSISVAPQSP